jgi:hypothetical protein
VLLFSNAMPVSNARLRLVETVLPLSVIETSHLMGSIVGVLLLLFAYGLQQRLLWAWALSAVLLCAGAVSLMLKGFAWEEAIALALLLLVLLPARREFQLSSSPPPQEGSFGWFVAIAYADGCRSPQGNDDRWIDRFCEDALIKSGRADEAYHRYGLKAATGPTYLAVYRETVKRYPERDRRQVLLDLIETRGDRGKWFAAAKDAGFLEVALVCARDFTAEPATLVRAARDFAAKEPKFAAEIGVVALVRLLSGSGYDPEVSLVQEALDHLLDAASRIGARNWAMEQAQALVDGPVM